MLTIAQSQASRARIALEAIERDGHNDMQYFHLASAIFDFKNQAKYSWGQMIQRLSLPCGEEMLRKIACRAKKPSPSLYKAIKQALEGKAPLLGIEITNLGDLK
jgi:hypothetical protein